MPQSRWLRFAIHRLVSLCAVLGTLVVGTFLIVQLIPGDPARALAGQDATGPQLAVIRHQLGLDRPLWHQFWSYLDQLAHGNLGTSFSQNGQQVSTLIGDRLPYTAELAFLGLALVLVVSIPLGLAVAVGCQGGRRGALDSGFTAVTSLFGAVPEYVLGTVLVALFALKLGWFPPAGAATLDALVLPVLAVAVGPICALARIVRREAGVVLTQEYLRTARGKRLGATRLHLRHALPNLLTSTLTLGGIMLTGLLGGTVVIETVFGWPGLGSMVVQAILARDYPVIQGIVLVLGLIATSINILIDILLGVLDPRRLGAAEAHA